MAAKHLRLLCLAVAALSASAADAAAGGGKIKVFSEPTQDYLDQKAQLEQMLTSRDVDVFEMAFEPLTLDRVVLQPRTGQPEVYQYLTFRLRNQLTDGTRDQAIKAKRYHEVLQHAADQYEDAKIENGVTLEVAGEKVLDRAELRARERRASLTAYAYDENGSRVHLLDEPSGSGPQEQANFPDIGAVEENASLKRVRDRVEEVVGRHLATLDELRATPLPAYDPAGKTNDYGEAPGEVFGVIIFDRLNDLGRHFTIEVRGLTNKIRVRQPDTPAGGLDNYLASRVMRRVYVLHYDHLGDEFFRDQDRFDLGKHGYEWVSTFQRVQARKDVAYARYFVTNIIDDKGDRNAQVEDEFWPYYDEARAGRPQAGDKLPDLKSTLQAK